MRPKGAAKSRKLIIVPAIVAVFAAQLAGAPSASAATTTPVVIVGTSDVFDSNLVQSVIEPGFEAAYPQFDFQYVSKGTGAAIAYAEAGTADGLIVHAASLENQFVGSGFSAEKYGRAIFWGDYVLTGPASDPAGVLNGGEHDIATAFEKIAAAGANGTANFLSRGGTPGTTVQEHAIWALTSGVTTCAVSTVNGGGVSPSTATGDCASPIALPSWYHATGLTQAPNILNGDTCNYPGGGCYVFTDRGTFNYLQSQGSIANLGIVTRDNSDDARGTKTALVNSFHAYAVNPKAFPKATFPNVKINSVGAADFLKWITSPAAQTAVGKYLNGSSDAPFIPSTAPKLTASNLPDSVTFGQPVEVTGTLSNVVPGTPALSGQTVNLQAVPVSTPFQNPVTVASAKTDSTGAYSISYVPSVDETYSVATGELTKVENSTLSPVFGDLLAPQATSLGTVTVAPVEAKASITKITVTKSYKATITVRIYPRAHGTDNIVQLYGRNNSKTPTDKLLKTVKVVDGHITVTIPYTLSTKTHSWKTLTWILHVVYSGPNVVTVTSAEKSVKLS